MENIKKYDIGQLEEQLWSSNEKESILNRLFDIYNKDKNIPQLSRIQDIIDHNRSQEKIYIKFYNKMEHHEDICIFPFSTLKNFCDISSSYNAILLAYMTRESRYSEILMDKRIAAEYPDMVQIVKNLCFSGKLSFRVLGTQETQKNAHLISDARDAQRMKSMLAMPSEIAIPPLTGTCNIKCRFCEQAYARIPYREMDFDVFRQAIAAVPEKIFIKTSLTPFQEPLSVRRFHRYLEYALKERPDANIWFNTNGSGLDEETARWLVDIGLKTIVISLNMPDAESYRRFTGADFFATVARNIETLYRVRQQKKSSFPRIITQFLKLAPVLGQMDALRRRWGAVSDEVWFRNVSAPAGNPAKLEEFKKYAPDIPDTTIRREPALPCSSMLVTCGIDMSGYYLPCCTTLIERCNAKKRKYKFLEFGHIREADVATAWQSPALRRIRAWQMAGLLAPCARCLSNQASLVDLYAFRNGLMRNCWISRRR